MFVRKIGAALLALCMSLSLSACRNEADTFPVIGEATSSTSQRGPETSAGTKPGNDGIKTLKVALPYSEETVKCLSAMFYAKNHGTWDTSVTGGDVDIRSLATAATNYVIQNIGVTNDGASLENLNGWKNSGGLPDLYLAADPQSAAGAGMAADLSSFASGNPYIDGSKIFAASISSQIDEGRLYGIPHYSTATVIFGNRDYIPKNGRLQAKYTTEDFNRYLEKTNDSNKCIPFASAYELLPYLGSCFSGDKSVSYMMFDEYRADKESAENVIAAASGFVKKLYDSKLTANTDKEGADPVFSRTAALWVGSSVNCRKWGEYYPDKLYYLHLPCNSTSNPGIPYLRAYSLCISKDCSNKQFAAEFAAFISYDEDAQMLIYRMENMEGLMPLVRSSKVWNMAANEGAFGSMVTDFRQTMDNAVYCPGSFDNPLYRNTNEYTASYFMGGSDRFNPEACYGID